MVAIRPGGKGDVAESHVAWTFAQGPDDARRASAVVRRGDPPPSGHSTGHKWSC